MLPHLTFGILIWSFKCEKVTKLQNRVIRILNHSKYNAHSEPLFKKHKLLKNCDILKLQELKFYYKYKNSKLPHYLQSLPFQPNSNAHDHATRIQQGIYQPMRNHVFVKKWIRFDIPMAVNNAPNCIIDKLYTHNLQGFSGYIRDIFYNLIKKIAILWTAIYVHLTSPNFISTIVQHIYTLIIINSLLSLICIIC